MSEVKPDLVVATVQGDDVQRYLCWHPDKPAFNYEIGAKVVLLSELERVQKISDNYYAICVDRAQELAALREELATLQRRYDRTESALNGSMKALTRVDNMWKKRWLDKTGEPAMALIVDDEFKALFEEIKGLKHSLAAAEQRNAELVASIVALPDEFKELSGCENTASVYACIDYISDWVAELSKPTESEASE